MKNYLAFILLGLTGCFPRHACFNKDQAVVIDYNSYSGFRMGIYIVTTDEIIGDTVDINERGASYPGIVVARDRKSNIALVYPAKGSRVDYTPGTPSVRGPVFMISNDQNDPSEFSGQVLGVEKQNGVVLIKMETALYDPPVGAAVYNKSHQILGMISTAIGKHLCYLTPITKIESLIREQKNFVTLKN